MLPQEAFFFIREHSCISDSSFSFPFNAFHWFTLNSLFKDSAYQLKGIFAWFTECAGKADVNKNAIEMQKENCSNHAIFKDKNY